MPAIPREGEPKKPKPKMSKGVVHIIIDRCKGCRFCIECCPKKILKLSSASNLKGYHYPVVIDEEGCMNCKTCEEICPDFAIFTVLFNNK